MMIKFFMKKGYTPLVMDTDGVNFSKPDGVEDRVYIGKGLNWKVKEGKEYRGDDADVAEFNDTFMRGEMALDTDGTWPSCINLARKNYAVMDAKGKIKLTGNTIKSKKLPLYIEDFLDKGVKQLLEGKGQEFIEWYYEYVQKIYNKQIPLMKIAQRAKVKLSIDDYRKRSKEKTKAGNEMSRMAHMELAIRDNVAVNLGDVIYYVNNGIKASHGDVQKVNKPKKGWSEETKEQHLKEFGKPLNDSINSIIQLNCYRIEPSDLENNPEMTGDYNVPRAIATFNKRIEPLLVVFKQEVRDGLIVDNPEDRMFFTKDQSELINGLPFEKGDQDTLEEVLTISEPEMRYWEKRGLHPDYMYELADKGWKDKLINFESIGREDVPVVTDAD